MCVKREKITWKHNSLFEALKLASYIGAELKNHFALGTLRLRVSLERSANDYLSELTSKLGTAHA